MLYSSFNSSNFCSITALAEVCALLSAVLGLMTCIYEAVVCLYPACQSAVNSQSSESCVSYRSAVVEYHE